MRVKFFTFVMTSFFIASAACRPADEEETAGETPEGAIEEAAAEDEPSEEGDAAAVDNASVKDKPLLKSCYKGDAFTCAVEATILTETNRVRGSRKALVHAFESAFVAREWSSEQGASGNLSHDGFPYDRKKVLLADFPNASWGFFAENVAVLSARETDPVVLGKQIVTMWQNSEGHLRNMLGDYSYLGAGVARVGSNVYATQLFH